jgi:hypothetical protein
VFFDVILELEEEIDFSKMEFEFEEIPNGDVLVTVDGYYDQELEDFEDEDVQYLGLEVEIKKKKTKSEFY